MNGLERFFEGLPTHPALLLTATLALLALSAWAADRLAHLLLQRVVGGLVRRSPMRWDDVMLGRGVLRRLAHAVPALVVHHGIQVVPGLPPAGRARPTGGRICGGPAPGGGPNARRASRPWHGPMPSTGSCAGTPSPRPGTGRRASG